MITKEEALGLANEIWGDYSSAEYNIKRIIEYLEQPQEEGKDLKEFPSLSVNLSTTDRSRINSYIKTLVEKQEYWIKGLEKQMKAKDKRIKELEEELQEAREHNRGLANELET